MAAVVTVTAAMTGTYCLLVPDVQLVRVFDDEGFQHLKGLQGNFQRQHNHGVCIDRHGACAVGQAILP